MHIQYAPFINVDGSIKSLDADLDGNVTLTVAIKGKGDAVITMTPVEAKKLFDEMKRIDVEGLAELYAS